MAYIMKQGSKANELAVLFEAGFIIAQTIL